MSSTKPKIPFTYADYKSLTASNDQRYELIEGELYLAPAPTTIHQSTVQNLVFLLLQHVRKHRCGRVLHAPVDVVLGEGNSRSVVQPDILFVTRERSSIVEEAEITGAPDLIVEVLSPSTADRDLNMKKTLYARNGVREYWIVDPEHEQIDVHALVEDGYGEPTRYRRGTSVPSVAVSGFVAPLAEIFRRD
jgi:Uma2 family endonuclease